MINNENRALRDKVLALAIPIILEQLAMILLGVVNTGLLSNFSNEAVSAAGSIDMFGRCILPLFSGLSTGATILVAQYCGRGEDRKACKIAGSGLSTGTAVSIIVALIIGILGEPIISLLFKEADAGIIPLAGTYFRITLIGYPLMCIYYITNGVMRGSGDSKTPLLTTFIMNCFNAGLSYILIYGVDAELCSFSLHIPSLGIAGAAFGITASRFLGALINMTVILTGKKRISLKPADFKPVIDKNTVDIFRLGIPYGFEQFLMQTGKLLLQVVVIGMGTVALTANTLGLSVMSLCMNAGQGFNLTAVTIVGQSVGMGEGEKARKYTKTILKYNLILMSAMSLLIAIFARPLFSLLSKDALVMDCGVTLVRIYALSQPFLAVVQTFSGSLRGCGNTRYPMIVTFVGVWLCRLIFGYIIGDLMGFGIVGVWVGMCIDLIVRSIMFVLRYKKIEWSKYTLPEVRQ